MIHSHDMVDNIERSIAEDLKIHLVAHMDPLDTRDPLTLELNEKIGEVLATIDGVIGMHDLRVVAGYTHNNIIFDVVIAPDCKIRESDIESKIKEQLDLPNKEYYFVITFDKSYVQNNI